MSDGGRWYETLLELHRALLSAQSVAQLVNPLSVRRAEGRAAHEPSSVPASLTLP
jgi:hypothetical protein